VPFEPDKISQALFAATENLAHPDAFLARELTDGVLHFLAQDSGATIPTTAQVGELVVKVVRELGQPALAQAFASGAKQKAVTAPSPEDRREVKVTFSPADPPALFVKECLRAYSLQAVFSRDLAAAQRDGLLTLTGLEAPLQLGACVVGSPDPAAGADRGETGLAQALTVAQRVAPVLCLDAPEYALAAGPPEEVSDLVREVASRLLAAGPRAVINLGCGVPPFWASDHPAGPLFADQRRPGQPENLVSCASALVEQLISAGDAASACRIDWHLGERDFATSAPGKHTAALLRRARWAVESPLITLVFDRPRQPIALGEGLNRRHPAALLAVGLHLPRLVELPGVRGNAPAFLEKLASLARLALSAAVQKRDFLRRQGKGADGASAVGRGFLLERARLVVVPVGLEAAVRDLTSCGLCQSPAALELGRQLVQTLRDVLHQDGRRANLESVVDGSTVFTASATGAFTLDGTPETLLAEQGPGLHPTVTGVTPWAPSAPVRDQLQAAGALHGAAGAGTAAVFLPEEAARQPAVLADLLHFAWRQTDVVRLRFVRQVRQQQLSFLSS
jgi:hypothetical protein